MDERDKIAANKVIELEEKKIFLEHSYLDSLIHWNEKYKSPEHCIMVNSENGYERLMTLSNFSTISGRQKSKKTFLSTQFIAAASVSGGVGKFRGQLGDELKCVLFDTEQSKYDTSKTGENIINAGGDKDNVMMFSLRSKSPKERVDLIEYVLDKFSGQLGYVVIDGIADLVNSINDEVEAVAIGTKLLQWTEIYNIHITCVIHQRKADNFARGHIGTVVMNKSECIINVTKDDNDASISVVSHTDQRGAGVFKDFEIKIIDGRLEILSDTQNYYKKREF